MRINEMIIADRLGREKGFIDLSAQLDLEIGGSNDFELTVSLSDYKMLEYKLGDRIYIPGTEYGGILADCETSTLEDQVRMRGNTWRGLLNKRIIEPPAGQDYRTASGDANKIIAEILNGWFDGVIVAETEPSNIQIENYQFERYIDGLTGLTGMLKTVNAKLELEYRQQSSTGCLIIRAVPIRDYSEELEYSNDQKVNFITRDYRMGVNHLICLGKGELKNQLNVHLYLDKDGNVGTQKYYTGIDEIAEVYEAVSQEDRGKLLEDGKKKLLGLKNYTELEISVQDIEAAVGDIVGGRERLTGLYMKQPITNKILKLDSDGYSIEYKVGE